MKRNIIQNRFRNNGNAIIGKRPTRFINILRNLTIRKRFSIYLHIHKLLVWHILDDITKRQTTAISIRSRKFCTRISGKFQIFNRIFCRAMSVI